LTELEPRPDPVVSALLAVLIAVLVVATIASTVVWAGRAFGLLK
jgi:hypothetical protein